MEVKFKAKVFNIKKAIENQNKVWQDGNPRFAPSDGNCWRCGKNIYEPVFKKYLKNNNVRGMKIIEVQDPALADHVIGIDVESAKRLVTGCPHCHRCYCD